MSQDGLFPHPAQNVEATDGRVLAIRPEHITNGNQGATLALLWATAIRFEVYLPSRYTVDLK